MGMGSKMGAVLTATEAAGEHRGWGIGVGAGLMCPEGEEKAGARRRFLEEAARNTSLLASLLEASKRQVASQPE